MGAAGGMKSSGSGAESAAENADSSSPKTKAPQVPYYIARPQSQGGPAIEETSHIPAIVSVEVTLVNTEVAVLTVHSVNPTECDSITTTWSEAFAWAQAFCMSMEVTMTIT